MGKAVILNSGEKFGHLTVDKYIGDASHLCICDCGNTCIVKTKSLRNGSVKSCGCLSNNTKIDMTGKIIGEWTVIREAEKKGYWTCQCTCGTIKDIDGHELRRGATKSCGHDRYKGDLTGQTFSEWTVIKKGENRQWLCQCSCGNQRLVHQYSLTSGKSKSCGCKNTKYKDYKVGTKFNDLELIEHVENQLFRFRCSCGNEINLNINSVINGNYKSCGCKQYSNRLATLIENNGDFKNDGKIRESWQIDAINSKEKLIDYLNTLSSDTSREEAAEMLGVTRTGLYTAAKRYGINIFEFIDARCKGKSPKEIDVLNYIKSICNCEIIQSDRKAIAPKELDIYIPEKHLAIEFNGTYWHSELVKDRMYHQNKTIECAKQGIRLIHIFEYEWDNSVMQYKIKKLLNQAINGAESVIHARKTTIKNVDDSIAKEFLNKYHLQGYTTASISLGCYYNNELVGMLTLGKPRFNNNYEYEIIRLCWKHDTQVIGGTEKLFRYFVNNYDPESILTYSDISKFTGNVYTRLGFNVAEITKPDYIWFDKISKQVLKRYQTQKSKLIRYGIADDNDTEMSAMYNAGYIRIFDSGNIRLIYKRGKK